ncbi:MULTISPECIES: hypothetical protein [Pantoea]|uniref:Phage protein n=1 Tax=Pantoea brenneri TaxID=472694 RepID=A0A7Y6NH17_9GAMM|nr:MULTISPECIES: hypothetical protein [Pantoea]MBZ6396991.1 hypothetical protein [Pantoea sp.]MBZ6440258.1 hypothetical protein [Pantoea sp.]NUY43478.1 hypothetical protein [Pantoea brenneri]NUY50956.1 hypothetical protein [Pantoea brenneri]NUY61313.1 hypothetical protein [Pantoea brenneri]
MKTTTATASEKFAPEINKMYHIHVAGVDDCFNGRVIAVTNKWFVLEGSHGHEQALPIGAVEHAQLITEQSQKEVASRAAAVKTLFPDMPDEMAAELADMIGKVSSMDVSDLELFLRGTNTSRH